MGRAVAPRLALSYVNRVDGRIHLRLELRDLVDTAASGVRVRLVDERRTKDADAVLTAAQRGALLDATFAPGALGKGTWHVHVRPNTAARFEDTGARVVIADPNPVSLLIGFDPVDQVPLPVVPEPVHTLPRRQQLAKSAGGLADRALTELPPSKAASVRVALRRAARKLSAKLPG